MWQNTKHGLYRQFNFDNFNDAEKFLIELLDYFKKSDYYPRLEIEGRVIQLWLINHSSSEKITNHEFETSKDINEIAEKYLLLDSNKTESLIDHDDVQVSLERVKLYADGGSRGNPGPSSSGFVVLDKDDKIIVDKGVYLGLTTNNQAEYTALKLGLEECIKLKCTRVDVFMDSLLVINQMKGIYKIKNRELWPIYNNIKNLINNFDEVNFQHVPREFNKLADAAVNRALDEELNK